MILLYVFRDVQTKVMSCSGRLICVQNCMYVLIYYFHTCLVHQLTQSLSDNSSLRKQTAQLNKHLQDAMDKFELISGEKVNLENFAETLQVSV